MQILTSSPARNLSADSLPTSFPYMPSSQPSHSSSDSSETDHDNNATQAKERTPQWERDEDEEEEPETSSPSPTHPKFCAHLQAAAKGKAKNASFPANRDSYNLEGSDPETLRSNVEAMMKEIYNPNWNSSPTPKPQDSSPFPRPYSAAYKGSVTSPLGATTPSSSTNHSSHVLLPSANGFNNNESKAVSFPSSQHSSQEKNSKPKQGSKNSRTSSSSTASSSASIQRKEKRHSASAHRLSLIYPPSSPGINVSEDEENPGLISSEDEMEESYSYTRSRSASSSISHSTSSTASLPSTTYFWGRWARAVILWMRSSINSRTKKLLMISSAASLAVVIAVIIYFYFALAVVNSDYNSVTDSENIRLTIELLFSSLLNAETSARGYVITGNPAFLGSYNQSIDTNGNDNLLDYLSSLFVMVNGDTALNVYRVPLTTLINERIVLYNESIAAASNFSAAQALVMSAGTTVMPMIRGLLNNMSLVEATQLASSKSNFSNNIITVTAVMSVVLFIFVIIIVVSYLISYDWDTRLLKRTNQKLEVLLCKAEEVTRLKSAFLANISHEIRTPSQPPLHISFSFPSFLNPLHSVILCSSVVIVSLFSFSLFSFV